MTKQEKEKLKELVPKIIQWATDRDLTETEGQYKKFVEEIGETADAYNHNKSGELKTDGIGDTFVTICNSANTLGLVKWIYTAIDSDLETGREMAYYMADINLSMSELMLAKENNRGEFCTVQVYNAINNLIGMCETYQLNVLNCVTDAYNVIKERTGSKRNGVYVKD